MSWNVNLTQEQANAASFCGSHSRLLAGPGTGKTRVLTRHILYLIQEKNIDPSKITVLTFTRAAAAELRKRVKEDLGDLQSFPNISTLHSFALKHILKNPTRTRLPQPLRIADDYEEDMIYEEMRDILKIKKKKVKKLFRQLSADWERLTAEDDEYESNFPNPRFLGTWLKHREIYGYTLRSELVYQLKQALEEGDFEFFHSIDYLLVDEYQDLNPCDLAVIRYLKDYGAEVYCAGDDDQSIYGFRFANPAGIRNFTRDYDPCKELELKTCMRCDEKILSLGNYVIETDPNPRRIEKDLFCREGADSGEVRILRFDGQFKEAKGIASICRWLIENKGINASKIMILLSSDKDGKFSKVIYQSFENLDIPAKTVTNPLEPLETRDGRIFLCLLHLSINLEDSLAWRVLLKLRQNNIGTVTLERIYNLALKEGCTFYESLEYVVMKPEVIPRQGIYIQQEMNNIKEILGGFNVDSIVNLSDFIETFASKIIEEEKLRYSVISLFKKVIQLNETMDLEKLLKILNVSLSDKEQEIDEESVSIMTMHQAKGLTADAIFIAAAEDEYIPGKAQREEEIGDFRRLLYVSLTRAKHYLYITHSPWRTGEQIYSGRNSGSFRRTLTTFLSGGPVRSKSGDDYISELILR